jgi:hypothetical protein
LQALALRPWFIPTIQKEQAMNSIPSTPTPFGADVENAASTRQMVLALNLDAKTYGTFPEIGAGQEVARWFFSVGGAAGTVAKTISAYDMAVTDTLYGSTPRYVSRQRLETMLEHEFGKLRTGLEPARGDAKCFFAFANTVTTGSYRHPCTGRGWLGVRFQTRPHEEPSDAGGARRQPDPRCLLPVEGAGGLDCRAFGRVVARARRDRHDQVPKGRAGEGPIDIEIDCIAVRKD